MAINRQQFKQQRGFVLILALVMLARPEGPRAIFS